MTCPQCHTTNLATARFCMNCGAWLPLFSTAAPVNPPVYSRPDPPPGDYPAAPSDYPTIANQSPPPSEYAPLIPPASGQGFTPPSEAAQQTGYPAEQGYLRYARPAGQVSTGPLTAPSYAAPPSQAAAWMQQANPPAYFYPPSPPPLVEQRSSFVMYITLAMVALLVMLGVSGYLLWGLTGQSSPSVGVSGGANALPGRDAQDAERKAIVDAINGSNQAQIDSQRTLSIDPLKQYTTGEEYQKQIDQVRQYQAQGVYFKLKLDSIQLSNVKVISDTEARANSVEQWSGDAYSVKNDRLLGHQNAMTLHETYYLVKKDGQWMVYKVEIQEEKNPTPNPNDNSQ